MLLIRKVSSGENKISSYEVWLLFCPSKAMVKPSAFILRLFLLMIKVTSLLPQTMHEAIDLRCINKLCLAVLKTIKNLSELILIFLG